MELKDIYRKDKNHIGFNKTQKSKNDNSFNDLIEEIQPKI